VLWYTQYKTGGSGMFIGREHKLASLNRLHTSDRFEWV